jgi:hypothetical protein
VAEVRRLRTRAERLYPRRCVIEGRALIERIASSGARPTKARSATNALDQADDSLAANLQAAGVRVISVRDSVLRQILGASKPVS